VFTLISVPSHLPGEVRGGEGILTKKDYFMTSVIYGPGNAFAGIPGAAQTILVMMSVLVAIDAPLQTGWHENGAIRNGSSEEYIKAVKRIVEMCVETIWGNSRGKPGS
jgi:hypothetical protein